ncbi:MAG: hypothetical protein KKG04_09405 [Candidatus Thermoplasmatota archaeon]|nr:hypothetical protein [Candidatus Thermoplasmatota archaeon]
MSLNYGGKFDISHKKNYFSLLLNDRRIAHLKVNKEGNPEVHIDKPFKQIKIRDNETEYIVEIVK